MRSAANEIKKCVVQQFDSLEEFCAAKAFNEGNASAVEASVRGNAHKGEEWLGVATIGDVEASVRGGWPEGAARVAKLAAFDAVAPISIKRRPVWADQGDSLDIHRLYSGQLDRAWRRMSRRAQSGSANITLVCSFAVNAGVKADGLFWRGATVLRAADALTDAGYNVRILALGGGHYWNAEDEDSAFIQTVTVKDYRAPLDINALAACLALAGFERVYGWRAMAALPGPMHWGMGRYDEDVMDQVISARLVEPMRATGERVFLVPSNCYDKQRASECLQLLAAQLGGLQQAA